MLEARAAVPIFRRVLTRASRRFLLRTAIFALGCCALATGLHAAAKPDYNTARTFAAELQQDFNQRNCIALLDRLDREAMRLRIFRPLGEDVAESADAKTVWTSSMLPVAEDDLQSLDHMTTLVVGRIILLTDGDRALECIFLNDTDAFRVVTLRLHEGPDGHVAICDVKFLGSKLEFTQRFRQNLILGGFKSHALLPDDELDLQHMAEHDSSNIHTTMTALNIVQPEYAYEVWSHTAEELQQSPMGKDLRARIAAKGSKKALAAMHKEWQTDPASNPMAAYNLALSANDLPQASVAVDLMLQETQQLAFLRGIKAGILLKSGQAEEALRLSRDVCELTPINGVCYVTGVRAAAELQRPQVALELLQQWSHIATGTSIDQVLKIEVAPGSGLDAFLKSAAYQDWLREASGPVTKKAG